MAAQREWLETDYYQVLGVPADAPEARLMPGPRDDNGRARKGDGDGDEGRLFDQDQG